MYIYSFSLCVVTIYFFPLSFLDDDVEYVNIAQAEKHNILTKYNFLNEEITGTGNVFSIANVME